MRQLVQAAGKFPWASAVFTAQQLSRLVEGSDRAGAVRSINAALYGATYAMVDSLSDELVAAFTIGDTFGRALLDAGADVLSGTAWRRRWWHELDHDFVLEAAAASQAAARPDLLIVELSNKYDVYNLVRNLKGLMDLPGRTDSLADLVARTQQFEPFTRIWLIEGIGHYYTLLFADDPGITGILNRPAAAGLPLTSMMMLHAGLGLGFSQHALAQINPFAASHELERSVDRFMILCHRNGREEYLGASYEALGLVTQTFHAQAVRRVDDYLGRRYPEVRGYYWHGVGRGLYFYPPYFLPPLISSWVAVNHGMPDEFAYRNAVAGMAWAFVLVNIRDPEVIACFLDRPEALLPPLREFTNGALSTMIMANATEPSQFYVDRICGHEIDDGYSGQLRNNWADSIGVACVETEPVAEELRRTGRLGTVFAYQDFHARHHGQAAAAGQPPRGARL